MKLSTMRRLRRNSIAVTGLGVIVAAAVGVLPADAAVPFASAAFSGSASGSAVHVDALAQAVNVDLAPASSAVNSKGLATAATSDTGGVINPSLASKQAYARGAGIDLLGSQIAALSEASAAPTSSDSDELGPVPLDPLAYASLARGAANARWNTDTCILGEDIARGLGYVADAQLVDTGGDTQDDLDAPLAALDASDPTRNVVQTVARQTLVPNADGSFGLRSQVSQTLAPVTIADTLTIEVAGEWVLTATATGIPGQSKVTYAPSNSNVTPTTTVLRVLQDGVEAGALTLQQLLGEEGLDIGGIIVVGAPPTSTIAADGTSVVSAVDVVKVTVPGLADVRVGHMEVKATVPSGGITCPIPVTKKATPSIVNSTTAPDGKFQVAITIKNSFACDLINVTATDEIIRKAGNVTFKIVEDDPRNDPKKGAGATFTTKSTTSATATYANLGTIPAGATKVLNVVIQVTGGSGEIQDTATAKGTLACAQGSAIGQANVSMAGSFTLITTVARVLARTGGEATMALLFGAAVVSSAAVRRIARRRNAS